MKPRILIVEDDALNARLFEEFLISRNFDVTVVYDGAKVMEAVTELWPDLVVLDIGLPHMSGLTILRQLKSTTEAEKIPVVTVSGYMDQNMLDAITEAGADASLPKPLALAEFENALRQCLLSKARATAQ